MAKVKTFTPVVNFFDPRPTVDMVTLQAVITYRYDVMTRYVNSARQVAKEEFDKLKVTARERRALRRLLNQSNVTITSSSISPAVRERFATLLGQSEPLSKIQSMREELESLWARSSSSHDQLVKQLQDWIARAEVSGIRHWEDFSLSVRRYAM